jgi:hypothetical protein
MHPYHLTIVSKGTFAPISLFDYNGASTIDPHREPTCTGRAWLSGQN